MGGSNSDNQRRRFEADRYSWPLLAGWLQIAAQSSQAANWQQGRLDRLLACTYRRLVSLLAVPYLGASPPIKGSARNTTDTPDRPTKLKLFSSHFSNPFKYTQFRAQLILINNCLAIPNRKEEKDKLLSPSLWFLSHFK